MPISRPTKSEPATLGYAAAMVAGGIVALIIGGALKSHFQLTAAVCNTYGGPTTQCTGNETLFTLGQVLQPVGGIVIALGVIAGLAIAAQRSKKNVTPRSSGTSRSSGHSWDLRDTPAPASGRNNQSKSTTPAPPAKRRSTFGSSGHAWALRDPSIFPTPTTIPMPLPAVDDDGQDAASSDDAER
jgi:hypothetical protein